MSNYSIETARRLDIDINPQKDFTEIWQIHFAPAPGAVLFADYDNRYFFIPVGDEKIFVRFYDIADVKFCNIHSGWTMRVAGKNCFQWKREFLERYPETGFLEKMAIYTYKRIA